MLLTDEDFIDIDVSLAIGDFRAGKVSECMLIDMMKEFGLSNCEIAVRLYEAKQGEGGNDVEDREVERRTTRQQDQRIPGKAVLAGADADC